MQSQEQLYAMRHSLAHIMATAVMKLWPDAELGVGPVVENGFYYDVLIPGVTISEEDLPKIQKEMKRIIKEKQPFQKSTKSINEAIAWAKQAKQPFKSELLNDLKREGTTAAKDLDNAMMGIEAEDMKPSKTAEVSFYTNGPFTDLCRGPHVEHTGQVGAFKLMRVSGAYWRGDEKKPQMQRLYGVGFSTKEELNEHLKMIDEAKKRDHRRLGNEMQLFFTTDLIGSGLPLMMPRGEVIKNLLMRYMRQEEESQGYLYVSTPVLTHEELYKRSGHAEYYLDDMYATSVDEEGNSFFIKPMNCPHHHMIYERMVNSYNDLPLKLSEHAGLYRNELSGTLTGLIRMRGPITQNDSHTYVTDDQLHDELKELMNFFEQTYRVFNFNDYWYRLSLPDFSKGKYAGDKKQWEYATKVIIEVLDEIGAKYVSEVGEAAFYGPKIDVQTRNVNGKEDSIATMQIDVLVPKRMELTYTNSDGGEQYPFVIHKSIMGAFERFMGFLLEKTAGHLPFWLAPEQVRILTINDKIEKYVAKIEQQLNDMVLQEPLRNNSLRISIDRRNESLGKKIREARTLRIPMLIIVGERDASANTLSIRTGDKEQTVALEDLQSFVEKGV